MKKILLFCAVLLVGFQAYGQIPPRYFEWGLDFDAEFANNYIGLTDILNPEKKVKIDLDLLPIDQGLSLDVDMGFRTFLNVQTRGKHEVGFGLSVGLDVDMYGTFPGEIMEFLSKGNAGARSFSGDIATGASIFADLDLEAHAKFGKLKLGLSPAMFIPVVYVPKPSGKIVLDTTDAVSGEFFIDAYVYVPVPLAELQGSPDSPGDMGSFMNSLMINPWTILDARGFDLSLTAEYELLPVLDLGGSVSHIPLLPAYLGYGMHAHMAYRFNNEGLGILDMLEDDFDFDELFTEEALETTYNDNAAYRVFRPLSFDVYVQYKPLKTKSIILKPNFGFSVLTVYEKALFNFGLEGKLDWKNFVSLTLRSGLRERVWRHEAAFMLNFRVLELDVGVALQSQGFKDSFKIKGAQAVVGVRLGF
jgi:hypothetical protein